MSLIWALIVLETSVTERYYEIVQYDENQKPQQLKLLDYGVREFINPLSMYSNEKIVGKHDNPLPTMFQDKDGKATTERDDLISQGYRYANPRDEAWVKSWDEDDDGDSNFYTGWF
jgi:hypothetical protein